MSFLKSEAIIAPPRFDPRVICNLILDEADAEGHPISNLALQKLLYFCHGLHLVEAKEALVCGYFEAWQFGPVHPTAYRAFKSAGAAPIQHRAVLRDPFTGEESRFPECSDKVVRNRIRRIVGIYSGMTPGRLVEVAHARGAPWRHIVDKSRTQAIFGLRIPNEVISELFKHHKVSVGLEPRDGEPRDEAPFM